MVIAEVAGRVVSGERFAVNELVFAGFLAIDGRKGEGGVLVGGHAGDCGQLPETGAAVARDGFGGGRCGGAAPAQGRAEGPTAK